MKKFKKLLALLLALTMVVCLIACEKEEDDDEPKKKKGSSVTEPSQGDIVPAPEPSNPGAVIPVTPPTTPTVPTTTPTVPTTTSLIGSWTAQLNMSGFLSNLLKQNVGAGFNAPTNPIYMMVNFTFQQNGQGSMSIYVDEPSASTYLAALTDSTLEFTYASAEAQGQTREAVDQGIMANYGMTTRAYIEAQMATTLQTLLTQTSQSKNFLYLVDTANGIVTVGDTQEILDAGTSTMEYELIGGKLIVKRFLTNGNDTNAMGLGAYGLGTPWEFTK